MSYPPRESSINLRRGYYSELPRYRDENLTYRQVKAAFDGMIDCSMIKVTTAGFYRRDIGSGELTRFIPTDQFLEKTTEYFDVIEQEPHPDNPVELQHDHYAGPPSQKHLS